MNTCYNYTGCGCQSYMPTYGFNPFGCGCQGYQSYPVNCNFGGFGGGCNWFAIVLVVFLLLIICGCTKIC